MTKMFIYNKKPIAASRPRVTKRGTYTAEPYNSYKKAMSLWAKHNFKPLDGAVSLHVYFYMPIPKSLSKKKQEELNGGWHIKRPDADNLVKAVKDSLNGYAYHDDSQVSVLFVQKKYSVAPRTEIVVAEI
jgi:Holliday junction resolvase RusA-like endonuclease